MRHARRDLRGRWFEDARRATWELYRRHGWGPLVYGPLPGHGVSGCEQTALVIRALTCGDPLAADQACAGIVAALDEIDAARATLRGERAPLSPRPVGPQRRRGRG